MLFGVIAAAAFALVMFGFGAQVGAQSGYGGGWWGPGMMMGRGVWMGPGMMAGYGYGMGPWMMGPNMMASYGYGMGPWMTGSGWYGTQTALNLSVDDVRSNFERWLAWQGNPRVKLGTVSEKDADTITADILTTDKDGLVQRFAVNRHTGFSQPSGD
jgi:hypothetical protein